MSSKSPTPETNTQDSLALTTSEWDLLLVIFIHGFKGTDTMFEEFPGRLQHILTETIPHLTVECSVFPAYEVRSHRSISLSRCWSHYRADKRRFGSSAHFPPVPWVRIEFYMTEVHTCVEKSVNENVPSRCNHSESSRPPGAPWDLKLCSQQSCNSRAIS